MSDFLLFEILDDDKNKALGLTTTAILINSQHVVSIKPIRILKSQDVINGYWIRTSNGKKYRAIKAPQSIMDQLENAHVNSQMIETIELNNSEFLEKSFQ